MGLSCSVVSDPWVRGCLVASWFLGRRSLEVLTSLRCVSGSFLFTVFAWAISTTLFNWVSVCSVFTGFGLQRFSCDSWLDGVSFGIRNDQLSVFQQRFTS